MPQIWERTTGSVTKGMRWALMWRRQRARTSRDSGSAKDGGGGGACDLSKGIKGGGQRRRGRRGLSEAPTGAVPLGKDTELGGEDMGDGHELEGTGVVEEDGVDGGDKPCGSRTGVRKGACGGEGEVQHKLLLTVPPQREDARSHHLADGKADEDGEDDVIGEVGEGDGMACRTAAEDSDLLRATLHGTQRN